MVTRRGEAGDETINGDEERRPLFPRDETQSINEARYIMKFQVINDSKKRMGTHKKNISITKGNETRDGRKDEMKKERR